MFWPKIRKGRRHRELNTLIGPNKAPLRSLLKSYWSSGTLRRQIRNPTKPENLSKFNQAACALAAFVPYGLTAILLTMLTGITVSPSSIWNWVQVAGESAMREIEEKMETLSEGHLPPCSLEGFEKTLMAIGADGVMVPFRPHGGLPDGKTVWREVKIGLVAWLQKKVMVNKEKSAALFIVRLWQF